MQQDMFSLYLQMIGDNEAPNTYHRWSFMTVLGAWLGRRCYVPFGDGRINCNMYVMLMGNAGARKSTAIKRATKLITLAGYKNIAASKTSKEKFLLDLMGDTNILASDDILEANLFGTSQQEDAEILIAADEFNVFLGNGNLEFLSLLGTLWDYDGAFENKTKNSQSAYIYNPTVSMLAGNTSTSFALAFPIEAIGQGIFSRLLIINGERTGRKITIPSPPDSEILATLLTYLSKIRLELCGPKELSQSAYNLVDKIYKEHTGIDDIRFESYNNRRLTHLLKLSLIVSSMELSKIITEYHVIKANTILTHAEHSMPRALGEFGKARNSDISHKIMTILNEANPPVVTFKQLWKQVCHDLERPEELKNMIANLSLADKILTVDSGIISKQAVAKKHSHEVDFSLLTEEERGGIIL